MYASQLMLNNSFSNSENDPFCLRADAVGGQRKQIIFLWHKNDV